MLNPSWFAWMLLTALVGCVNPETSATTCINVSLDNRILVLESDLSTTSGLALMDETGCLTEVAGGLALGGDTTLAASGGRVFVVDRGFGLVHEIDPNRLQIIQTYSAFGGQEAQSNPQDVAVDNRGRLWVTRFDQPSLAILDGDQFDTLDLSAFADADGFPEMAAIRIVNDRAYVALQLLDKNAQNEIYPPTGPGTVLSISTDVLSDVQPIQLVGANPFGRFADILYDNSMFAMTTPGRIKSNASTDGIELVDIANATSQQLISEIDLGGFATELAFGSPTEAYAIVADTAEGNPTRVVAWDPSTRTVTRMLAQADGYYHWGLTLTGAYVVIGERTPGQARLLFADRQTGVVVAQLPVQQLAPVALLSMSP